MKIRQTKVFLPMGKSFLGFRVNLAQGRNQPQTIERYIDLDRELIFQKL
jgi:hypothetical protein